MPHFAANYGLVFLLLGVYSLLSSPLLLMALAVTLAGIAYIGHRNSDFPVPALGTVLRLFWRLPPFLFLLHSLYTNLFPNFFPPRGACCQAPPPPPPATTGRNITPREQMAAVAVATLPLYYMGAAGSTVFWLLGATFSVVLAHAALVPIPPPAIQV